MPKYKTAIIFILLGGVLLSCGSTKNVAGVYKTNFASMGFFGTTIRLNPDSTLQYVFQGDLIYASTTGRFRIYDRKLYMTFDKAPPDTNKLYYWFNTMPLKTIVISGDTIHFQDFCYIGHDKLFLSHKETGKRVTKATRYNKRKRYVFFGTHYYKRRWYLMRVD